VSPRPGGDVSNSSEYAILGGSTGEVEAIQPGDLATAESHQGLRDVGKSVAALVVRDHPTLMLTLVYLGLTFVGFIHDFFFYMYFKINILDFSETSDFLLAAIRNPLVILLAMLPVPVLLLYQSAIRRSKWYKRYTAKHKNTKWNSVPLRAVSAVLFILVYASLFTQLYAFRDAARTKAGHGQRVSFLRNDGVASDEQPILLGTTGKFFFLYYPSRKATEIVPIDNAVALTVDSRRRKEREQDSLAAMGKSSPTK
jgi:hypothetical protein